MQFTTKQVHGNLAWNDNVLITFSAADFIDVELEVFGSFVDDLLWSEVLWARLTYITDKSLCC
ncbi:hypothetical protein D3C86_2242260 [compost metagenome]